MKLLLTLCVILAIVGAVLWFSKGKTPGEKVDSAIEKTEETARTVRDNTKEWIKENKQKAKDKAHEGVDKL